MSSVLLKMIIAGILFGTYPILVKYSELNGVNAAFVIVVTSLLILLPFVDFNELFSAYSSLYWLAILGGGISIIALIVFINGLVQIHANGMNYAVFFALMVGTQLIVPAIHRCLNEGITVRQIIGFCAVALAAYLLAPST